VFVSYNGLMAKGGSGTILPEKILTPRYVGSKYQLHTVFVLVCYPYTLSQFFLQKTFMCLLQTKIL